MIDIDSNARAIFYEALDRSSPEEQSAYLEEACGQDADLRNRVDDLLWAHREAGNFLGGGPSAEDTIEHSPIAERPGTVIGPYKLLQQIGEGGFGVVFLAEQERPVKRKVALKIIKPGMDTRQVIARFEAERQALALMDHPNISRVFDAGTTETGRPYFVMELVKGVAITDYCDQCNLTACERLELFISVCHAVQHAHQKGIIHRDLKPTNVLVTLRDGKAEPKIIDFGVAKAIGQQPLTERTLATAFAQMIGTPMYMSPEQAELSPLGIDTRSDIYSLGVMLYELLTGSTPFDRSRLHEASYDELRRIIREEEPPRPSVRISTLAADLATTVAERRRTDARRLQQAVTGDLDWIVMKCLEKERSRRYESPSSLARDVERHLRDEPVQACPPSIVYRATKFFRRNKAMTLTAMAIIVSLTASTGLSTGLYLREREARRQSELGYMIDDIANPFHNNSPEAADEALELLVPQVEQMDLRNRARLNYAFGDIRGRQGRWEESARYFGDGLNLELDQASFEPYHYYLPVLVQSGALDKYQKVRNEVIRLFGNTTDPRVAECVLKDCLITPWKDVNFENLDRLADTALRAENHWARRHFLFAKALLEYRRANFELASQYLTQIQAEFDPYCAVQVYMLQAMLHHQQGDSASARNVLATGLAYADSKIPRGRYLFAVRLWNDWIIAHALMKEATELIDKRRVASEDVPVTRPGIDEK